MKLVRFIASLFVALVPVCVQAQSDFIVDQAVDMSGPRGCIGRDISAGAKTYFDYINSQCGANGCTIARILRDDCGKPKRTVLLTREFLEFDKVLPHPNDPHVKVGRKHAVLMNKYRHERVSHLTLEGFTSAKSLVHGLKNEEVRMPALRGAIHCRALIWKASG